MKSDEGGSLCGKVRFRVTAEALKSGYCHCRMCQRNSGAPVVAWVTFPATGFSWIAGTPGTYASSARAKRQFCAACGSYLIFRSEDSPAEVSINTASLDDPDAFPPTMHRPEVKVASSVPGRLRSKNHEPCVYATAARRKGDGAHRTLIR